MRTPALLVAIVISGGALVQGQGLGEAAAKEKDRRSKIHGAGPSFTDSDLKDTGAKRGSEGSGTASPKPDAAATSDDALDSAAVESAKKARGLELKTRLAAVSADLTAAQARLKEAQRQWDSVYMHSVGYPLDQAAAHLEKARNDVARLTTERDEIEGAARREGIPPGYMR